MIELLGFFLPPVIDLINRKILNEDVRLWISIVICIIFGLAFNYIGNHNHFGDQESIAKSILAVIGEAHITFKAVWGKSAMRAQMYGNG